MEFSSTLRGFIYRIEPKPGGGFIATCKDSALPPIEGDTRDEVQQKIQERLTVAISDQIPALKSVLESSGVKLHYHIEPNPGGGFIVHHGDANSTDPAHAPVEGSTRDHLESFIESKLFSAFMARLPPELHQQLTEKLNSGGLDIDVNRNISLTTGNGAVVFDSDKSADQTLAGMNSDRGVPHFSPVLGEKGSTSSDSPITRYDSDSPVKYEKSSFGTFLRLLLAAAILAAMAYILLYRH